MINSVPPNASVPNCYVKNQSKATTIGVISGAAIGAVGGATKSAIDVKNISKNTGVPVKAILKIFKGKFLENTKLLKNMGSGVLYGATAMLVIGSIADLIKGKMNKE